MAGSGFWKRAKPEKPGVKKLKVDEAFVSLEELTLGSYFAKKIKVRCSMGPNGNEGSKMWLARVTDNSGERYIKCFEDGMANFQQMQFNKLYEISNFAVRKGFFDQLNPEIVLSSASIIKEICNEEEYGTIPVNRCLIKDVMARHDGQIVDIIAIVTQVIANDEITDSWTGRKKVKTSFFVTDESKEEVKVIIWDSSKLAAIQEGDIIIFRGVSKNTYTSQVDGSMVTDTQIKVNERTTHVWVNAERKEGEDVKKAVMALKEAMDELWLESRLAELN